jgi:hypothetical protein
MLRVDRSGRYPILTNVTHWYCPACHATSTTTRAGIHVQGHVCPKMGMLSVPMVRAGLRAKVERTEREDYIGRENVRLDAEGRPTMNVTVTRDEGTDVAVYAPTATLSGSVGDL